MMVKHVVGFLVVFGGFLSETLVAVSMQSQVRKGYLVYR